jgi:GT2 family glycosyltransferase
LYDGHSLGVVVPAHNEAAHLRQVVARVPAFVDEIIVVDDASVDETEQICQALAGGRVVCIRHQVNRGVGAAIVTGWKLAIGHGLDIVAVMDGDGQMDPADLEGLVEPLVRGEADFAKGCRFDGLRPRGPMPALRWLGNLAFSHATRLAAGWRAPLDAQCGYVALTAEALGALPIEGLYPRYGFPNDLFMRALECGLEVRVVPVGSVYGTEVSGLRAHVAVPAIGWLLAKGLARRWSRLAGGRRGLTAEQRVECQGGIPQVIRPIAPYLPSALPSTPRRPQR